MISQYSLMLPHICMWTEKYRYNTKRIFIKQVEKKKENKNEEREQKYRNLREKLGFVFPIGN